MAELLHKKVRIENDGLTSKGRVIADQQIADSITEKPEKNRSSFISSVFLNYFLWMNVNTDFSLEYSGPGDTPLLVIPSPKTHAQLVPPKPPLVAQDP